MSITKTSRSQGASLVWATIVALLLFGIIVKPDQSPIFIGLFSLGIAIQLFISQNSAALNNNLIEFIKRREEIKKLENKAKRTKEDNDLIEQYYCDLDYFVDDAKIDEHDAIKVLGYFKKNTKKMKKNVLSVEISAPVETVFEFTCNPANTLKWIPNILEEKKNTKKTRVGTIYRQKWKGGKESSMVITGFIPNKQLDFHSVNGTYKCMYKYEQISNGTRLTYSEENGVDKEIDGPFTQEYLIKLKQLIEEK